MVVMINKSKIRVFLSAILNAFNRAAIQFKIEVAERSLTWNSISNTCTWIGNDPENANHRGTNSARVRKASDWQEANSGSKIEFHEWYHNPDNSWLRCKIEWLGKAWHLSPVLATSIWLIRDWITTRENLLQDLYGLNFGPQACRLFCAWKVSSDF